MRRIKRAELAASIVSELQLLQRSVDTQVEQGGFDAGKHWKGKRKSQVILEVYATLKRMAGTRERCMYCVDSEGSDIEHFWPKTKYPESMYVWENLLIGCTPCGRFKGEDILRPGDETPMLNDPTKEDPWEFLDFDPDTGNLNARYLLSLGEYSFKGQRTVTVLHLDKREGVSAGYRKTYNRLCQLFTEWTNQHLATDYVERVARGRRPRTAWLVSARLGSERSCLCASATDIRKLGLSARNRSFETCRHIIPPRDSLHTKSCWKSLYMGRSNPRFMRDRRVGTNRLVCVCYCERVSYDVCFRQLSFAYSDLASMRIGMLGSASFHRFRKVL